MPNTKGDDYHSKAKPYPKSSNTAAASLRIPENDPMIGSSDSAKKLLPQQPPPRIDDVNPGLNDLGEDFGDHANRGDDDYGDDLQQGNAMQPKISQPKPFPKSSNSMYVAQNEKEGDEDEDDSSDDTNGSDTDSQEDEKEENHSPSSDDSEDKIPFMPHYYKNSNSNIQTNDHETLELGKQANKKGDEDSKDEDKDDGNNNDSDDEKEDDKTSEDSEEKIPFMGYYKNSNSNRNRNSPRNNDDDSVELWKYANKKGDEDGDNEEDKDGDNDEDDEKEDDKRSDDSEDKIPFMGYYKNSNKNSNNSNNNNAPNNDDDTLELWKQGNHKNDNNYKPSYKPYPKSSNTLTSSSSSSEEAWRKDHAGTSDPVLQMLILDTHAAYGEEYSMANTAAAAANNNNNNNNNNQKTANKSISTLSAEEAWEKDNAGTSDPVLQKLIIDTPKDYSDSSVAMAAAANNNNDQKAANSAADKSSPSSSSLSTEESWKKDPSGTHDRVLRKLVVKDFGDSSSSMATPSATTHSENPEWTTDYDYYGHGNSNNNDIDDDEQKQPNLPQPGSTASSSSAGSSKNSKNKSYPKSGSSLPHPLDDSTTATWRWINTEVGIGMYDVTRGQVPLTIQEGAPTNSVVVNRQGRVGLGTSTPLAQLHLQGDLPFVRLEEGPMMMRDSPQPIHNYNDRYRSSERTPLQARDPVVDRNAWEIGATKNGFSVLEEKTTTTGYEDDSRGSTKTMTMPFQIKSGAPDRSFVVDEIGFVGLGTDNPSAPFHVVGSARFDGTLQVGRSCQLDMSTCEWQHIGHLHGRDLRHENAPSDEQEDYLRQENDRWKEQVALLQEQNERSAATIAALEERVQQLETTVQQYESVLLARIVALEERDHPTAATTARGRQ
ncbi:hypothetical protein ACA910_017331 [Epithemia clementina (nom. ined.)]